MPCCRAFPCACGKVGADMGIAGEQASGRAAVGRPSGAEWHFVGASDGIALARPPGVLRAVYDLLQPVQPLAQEGCLGPVDGCGRGGLRRQCADDRQLQRRGSPARGGGQNNTMLDESAGGYFGVEVTPDGSDGESAAIPCSKARTLTFGGKGTRRLARNASASMESGVFATTGPIRCRTAASQKWPRPGITFRASTLLRLRDPLRGDPARPCRVSGPSVMGRGSHGREDHDLFLLQPLHLLVFPVCGAKTSNYDFIEIVSIRKQNSMLDQEPDSS